jgi:hypothetical protein
MTKETKYFVTSTVHRPRDGGAVLFGCPPLQHIPERLLIGIGMIK